MKLKIHKLFFAASNVIGLTSLLFLSLLVISLPACSTSKRGSGSQADSRGPNSSKPPSPDHATNTVTPEPDPHKRPTNNTNQIDCENARPQIYSIGSRSFLTFDTN